LTFNVVGKKISFNELDRQRDVYTVVSMVLFDVQHIQDGRAVAKRVESEDWTKFGCERWMTGCVDREFGEF
jgi:hypothetical protein